ncbi:MAG: hypothetical protein O3C40_10740 [Planctomycetota bacterium]|nr:hypothetical protein [Planctomycetota bacterium]
MEGRTFTATRSQVPAWERSVLQAPACSSAHARREPREQWVPSRSLGTSYQLRLLLELVAGTADQVVVAFPAFEVVLVAVVHIAPMRTLFRENRMISSITAELDQKSCWEVLTDPELTQ